MSVLVVLVLWLVSAAGCLGYSPDGLYEAAEPIADVYAVTTTGESILARSFEEFTAKIHKLLCPSVLHYMFSEFVFSSVKDDPSSATRDIQSGIAIEDFPAGVEKFESTMKRYHKTFCNSVPRMKKYSYSDVRDFIERAEELEGLHFENYSKVSPVVKNREAYLWITPRDVEYTDPKSVKPKTSVGFTNENMKYYYTRDDEVIHGLDLGGGKMAEPGILDLRHPNDSNCKKYAAKYLMDNGDLGPVDEMKHAYEVLGAPPMCYLYGIWNADGYIPPLSRRKFLGRSLSTEKASSDEKVLEETNLGRRRVLRDEDLVLSQEDEDEEETNNEDDSKSVVDKYGLFTSFQIMAIGVLIPIGVTFYISMKAAFSI